MKHNSVVRRTLCITGSAVMLAGLLSGYTYKDAAAVSVPAAPAYSVSRPSSDNITAGSTCVVTATSLYVRSGPGEYYASRGMLTKGYSVKILEVDGRWGRISDGWICLDYVRLTSGGSGSSQTPAKAGTVTATTLNIRSGPGTNYSTRGTLTKGYQVNLLELKNGWGRIDEGWVSLKYISGYENNTSNSGSGSSVTSGSTVQVTADYLNIRQGAGTNYARVGHLNRGDKVTVLEVSGSWGRISSGWISLNYVKYVDGGSSSSSSTSKISEGDTVKVTASALRVRKGAGTNYPEIGVLYEGRTVKIVEILNGWGRIEDGGWISLSYVKNANASW